MANSFLRKVSSTSTSTLSGWVLTFLCGIVFSQSVSIERLSQRQQDSQQAEALALSAIDRQIQDHNRDDRERDAYVTQLNLEITRLHATDQQTHIEMSALADRFESFRNERKTALEALTSRFDQGREERRDDIKRLQDEINELRSAIGFVDGDTKTPKR